MATWDPADELNNPPDFLLVQNGFISLFFQQSVLEDAAEWLALHGYRVISLDAAEWQDLEQMHVDIASALEFPAFYGGSFDALNDCLSEVAVGSYGWSVAADTGLVLVLRGYAEFSACDPVGAHRLLDVFARQASYAALFGHRLMCLVHSSDPQLSVPPVGGTTVMWNYREVADSARQMRGL
ncbi:barstar family protein [Pseudarthrobacter sp. NPDC058329]|uniref:barstar family protein n=1 Tax=Pseudarthrobacter sp. NPDC058329 TaxID=3346448 RepID=UPI0036DE5E07